ncbi:MAG TPA: ATP-binding protein [bacterium]|jgi:two-component system sensor histidine kinase/response regulator|nr:ATP-binding protein [bacterium]
MGERGKILMVDDEPGNLLALEAVLEDLGHELVRAYSGRDALRRLMNEDFSVILLDVQMPGMDGFETALLIRSRERSKQTPIVFLTAVGRSETEMSRGYQVGAVDYLVKPFIPEILRYKVSVLMDLQAKTRELQTANQDLSRLNATLEERVRDRTAELENQSRQLARSNEELNQFASVASHDLREPLRSMSTYLYFLERDLGQGLGADAREHMTAALDSAKRMDALIAGLLAFSGVDASGQQQGPVVCDRLVKEVIEMLASVIQDKEALVVVGKLPVVRGNPAMLRQVFQNLVDNALKFSGKSPRIELGGETRGDEALLWVRDNGIGIEAKDYEKVFKLFKRLHTREEYPGSGLGLALCKKIVERHGGRLWVESKPGNGSTFYFSLRSEVGHGDGNVPAVAAAQSGGR